MASGNAAVEKLKALGLKHGEKAVVGLSVTLFLLFVVMAITKKTIELRPEDLATKAKSAESNLAQRQNPETILAKLASEGLKPETDFEVTVDKQQKQALDPNAFAAKQKWVTPEPGAGRIRDTPELIAPTDLVAFPNRGGYLVFDLDKEGNRIVDDGKDAPKRKQRLGKSRRPRGMGRRGGAGGMAGGMSGGPGMGGMPGAPGGMAGTAKQKAAEEKRRKDEEERLRGTLAGATKDDNTKEEKAAAAPGPAVAYKEVVKGYRSVVITAKLDHKKMRDNYLLALKDPAIAQPNYQRVDVQRQSLQSDGSWSKFTDVDDDENLKVLDNLPEIDEELVPPTSRLEALVDPLPFAKAGNWLGVHVASLVPKEKLKVEGAPGGGGFPGMPGMGMGMSAEGGMGGPGRGGMPGGMGPGMGGPGGPGRAGMPGGMSGVMGPGAGGMMGGPGMATGGGNPAGPADETDFDKSDAPEIMVRSIDFTVQPDVSYRYRLRIVVVNPNRYRSDVSPGTDTEEMSLFGPFSEPSDEVTVPADVAAYALNKAPSSKARDDLVNFQIARWDSKEGHTVVRTDLAGPGQLIGEPAQAEIPATDGSGSKSKPVDFNTHRFVLDAMGGQRGASPAVKGSDSAPFDYPALSLVARPDGTVAIHTQARDLGDEVRVKMERQYKENLKNSKKKREPWGGMGMGMGMGGAGGMGMGGSR